MFFFQSWLRVIKQQGATGHVLFFLFFAEWLRLVVDAFDAADVVDSGATEANALEEREATLRCASCFLSCARRIVVINRCFCMFRFHRILTRVICCDCFVRSVSVVHTAVCPDSVHSRSHSCFTSANSTHITNQRPIVLMRCCALRRACCRPMCARCFDERVH